MTKLKIPSAKSQEGQTLFYLLKGHRVNHLQFQGSTQSYCLRAPVFNLRQDGWPIDDVWHTGGISPVSGRRTRFKKYFIGEGDLREIRAHFGERLDKFLESVGENCPQAANLEGSK